MNSTARIAVAAVALVSFGAFAQTTPTDIDADDTDVNVNVNPPAVDVDTDDDMDVNAYEYDDGRPNLISRIGVAADIGGGVHDFVDNGLAGLTDTGGSWQARVTVGTRSFLAGELAYVGTANPINALGLDDRAVLVSNGFEALARVNAMTGEWQPYAVAGYTYRRFEVQNTAINTSAIADGDNDHEIPVGLGLAFRRAGFVGDLRFMVHPSVSSDLIPAAETLPTALSLGLKVGFEF